MMARTARPVHPRATGRPYVTRPISFRIPSMRAVSLSTYLPNASPASGIEVQSRFSTSCFQVAVADSYSKKPISALR